jgi:hypothetical protein
LENFVLSANVALAVNPVDLVWTVNRAQLALRALRGFLERLVDQWDLLDLLALRDLLGRLERLVSATIRCGHVSARATTGSMVDLATSQIPATTGTISFSSS